MKSQDAFALKLALDTAVIERGRVQTGHILEGKVEHCPGHEDRYCFTQPSRSHLPQKMKTGVR